MRVLHVHSGNLYGGVETFLRTAARHQSTVPEMQHAYALCFEGRLSHELRRLKMPVHLLGQVQIRKPWSVWRARRLLRNSLKNNDYTHVVCHSPWAQALFGAVGRRASIPQALFVHGALNGRHWLERLALSSSPDGVLANSHFTAEVARKFFPESQTATVYCPHDVCSPVVERDQTRAELGVGETDVIIIQVARMEEGKGHRLLLEALAGLKAAPPWRCWVVGGSQRSDEERHMKSLRILARQLGIESRVFFMGEREDVPRLLAAADICCQPNIVPEGFGLALVEAMAARLPVVTSRLGAAPEVVDSQTGLLVSADPLSVTTALKRLVENPAERRRLGENGPARARKLCDPTQQLTQLASALANVRRRGGGS